MGKCAQEPGLEGLTSFQLELRAHLAALEWKLDLLAVQLGLPVQATSPAASTQLSDLPTATPPQEEPQQPEQPQQQPAAPLRETARAPSRSPPLLAPQLVRQTSECSMSSAQQPSLPGSFPTDTEATGVPVPLTPIQRTRIPSLSSGETTPPRKQDHIRSWSGNFSQSPLWRPWQASEKPGSGALTKHLTKRIAAIGEPSAQALQQAESKCLWRLVHGTAFQAVTSTVIVLNAIFVGLFTDMHLKAQVNGTTVSPFWDLVELAFSIFFQTELALRLLAERLLFMYGPEWRWNLFDSTLVSLSVIDMIYKGARSGGGDLGNVTLARMFRVVRFVRIIRVVRAVRAFHSLRLVVFAIYESMVSLIWCFIVVGLIIYVFAVCFLHGVAESLDKPWVAEHVPLEVLLEYYGSVPRAVVSLFMTISGGVDWYEAMKPLKAIHWLYEPVFNAYVFFMVIGVLNVVVGAFVAATADIASKDRDCLVKAELTHMMAYTRKIRTFFQEADKDKSGMLSWQEFKTHLQTPEVSAYLQALELDVSQARSLFELLDRDGSDEVSLDEFLAGCMRLKGQAKSIDVNILLHENRRLFQKLTDFIQKASGDPALSRSRHRHGSERHATASAREAKRPTETQVAWSAWGELV